MRVGEPNTAMALPAAVREGSRRPEPGPPQAGWWCSRSERRPHV